MSQRGSLGAEEIPRQALSDAETPANCVSASLPTLNAEACVAETAEAMLMARCTAVARRDSPWHALPALQPGLQLRCTDPPALSSIAIC